MNQFADGIPLEFRIGLEKQAGAVIEGLMSENERLTAELGALTAKIANFERKERALGLARTMEERGYLTNRNFDEKVAHILRQDDLDKVVAAMDLATDDGTKMASVADLPSRGTNAAAQAVTFFTNPDYELGDNAS